MLPDLQQSHTVSHTHQVSHIPKEGSYLLLAKIQTSSFRVRYKILAISIQLVPFTMQPRELAEDFTYLRIHVEDCAEETISRIRQFDRRVLWYNCIQRT